MKPDHSDIPELLEWLSRMAVVNFVLNPDAARRYLRTANILSELSGVKIPEWGQKKPSRRKKESQP